MCIAKVIRSKDDTKEKIKEFYTFSKQLYGAYLIRYDFMENASFWKKPI
jgi:hypothetical protein